MTPAGRPSGAARGLGYQPALDGLRAISVIAVVLYHAGFDWMHGGFFGVEVFFVISGFLITSLLLDERVATGATALGAFWLRRARRLLPALFVMLAAVAAWGLLFGSAEQAAQLKRDLPWSLFYVANWGQIVGDVPYFASADPPLLRHLWSLAVEEQWYLVWPIVFVGLCRLGWRAKHTAMLLMAAATAGWVAVWLVQRSGPGPFSGPLWLDGADRINVMYLSTLTRSPGLLVGAALAFAWRPWQHGVERVSSRLLDIAAVGLFALLGVCFVLGDVTASVTYPWIMALVSLLSGLLVLLTIDPEARLVQRLVGSRPTAAIGRRSYGIYLWHWPVFVIVGATTGSWWRFLVGSAIAVVLSELCYRFVELPIRHGAIERRWHAGRRRLAIPLGGIAVAGAAFVVGFSHVSAFDAAVGSEVAEFALPTKPITAQPSIASSSTTTLATPATTTALSIAPVSDPAATSAITTTTTTSTTTSTTLPVLPRSVAIVGDSQAHSLAVNLPSGVDDYFTFVDGSVDGCSVHNAGRIITARLGFTNNFGICRHWANQWGDAAAETDVALVMLGAWDVFDLDLDGELVAFASPEWDRLFNEHLQLGLDALAFAGAHAAVLEVPCMRPIDARGAGVPALPERGDDARTAHVNALLRLAARRQPDRVTFVEGPDEWCDGGPIATDTDYRWDGVHVYQRGAKLILETIAPALLAIPVDRP